MRAPDPSRASRRNPPDHKNNRPLSDIPDGATQTRSIGPRGRVWPHQCLLLLPQDPLLHQKQMAPGQWARRHKKIPR